MALPILPGGRSKRGSHQLSACGICERYAWLRYDQRYVLAKDKPYRLRGTLIHLCMAYHYAGLMIDPPEWYRQTSLDTALDTVGAGFPRDVELAKRLLESYKSFYPTEPWMPHTIEQEFETTIGELDPGGPDPSLDSEVVTCRPDILVKLVDPLTEEPGLWIFDYKTAGKNWEFVDGRWIMRGGLEKWKEDGDYVLNWQVLVNLRVLRASSNAQKLGIPVKGFFIQRMTREPDRHGNFQFDRHILRVPVRPYAQTPRLMRLAVADERRVFSAAAEGNAPRANFWACTGKFGPCDYREVCVAPTTERQNELLSSHYTRE